MIYTPRSEFFTPDFPSSEAKVGQSHSHLLGIPATSFDFLVGIPTEDVLGLQVTMINIEGVAILNRVEQLKKDLLDEGVIAEIAPLVKNLGEKVAVGAVVHDDKRVLVVLDYPVKSNNIGVTRCELVEGDLANVELALAGGVALGRVW